MPVAQAWVKKTPHARPERGRLGASGACDLGDGMADESIDERLEEIEQTARAALTLAEDPEAFLRALEAFRTEDAEHFQSELSRAGLLQDCHRICRWFCSKHCVFICHRLAGPTEGEA